jgi:gliding motility-associated lipoprotein GldH
MKTRNSILLALLVTVLFSCSEAPFYEKVYSFENKNWKQNDKLKYVVDIQDLEQEYDFTLSVRTTTDYKFNNLWVFMKTEAPDGASGREPYEIKIANEDGSWIGTKTGTVVETSLSFSRRKLPIKGKYTFTIEQGITASKIDEVLDLVFTVEESKKPQD